MRPLTELTPDDRGAIAALLRDHPWPPDLAGERHLEWLWTIDVALTPTELWPLISDVSRLNRALGNPEMKMTERDGLRHGRGRYGGLVHEWHELPWDWVSGQWFRFLRIYSRGGVRAVYSIHKLIALPDQRTRLQVYFGVIPRWPVLVPAVRMSFSSIGRAYRRVVPTLATSHRGAMRPPVFELAPPPLRAGAEARLRGAEATLRALGVDEGALARLVDHVRHGDELELARIQVRERARAWAIDEDALLRACLHATRAGLLELAWDVVCPHCRGVRSSERHLSELTAQGRCDVCAVTFGTADAIEVSFRVHASIREITARLYCSAEPSTKQHIHAQRALAPGADDTISVDLRPGRYRLRRRGADAIAGFVEVRVDAPASTATWRSSTAVGTLTLPPPAILHLVNDGAAAETFVVEDAQQADDAMRPVRLLSHPDFRDLYSEEYLAADVGLAIGEQTILFTDIVGSTAMYVERGDPGAFVAVRAHFSDVFAVVAAHHGAVIKTIGDAVMATFNEPLDAVRAAEALQRAFGPAAALHLRLSLNTGPCIAVKLNANLDYFGHTVNLAAKLQGLAEAGQVGVSAETMAAPGVAEHLRASAALLEQVTLPLKGVAAPLAAWRWTVWRDDDDAGGAT